MKRIALAVIALTYLLCIGVMLAGAYSPQLGAFMMTLAVPTGMLISG